SSTSWARWRPPTRAGWSAGARRPPPPTGSASTAAGRRPSPGRWLAAPGSACPSSRTRRPSATPCRASSTSTWPPVWPSRPGRCGERQDRGGGRVTVRIVPSADVDERAEIGDGSSVWHLAQVREHAVLGRNCIVGRGAYVGPGVRMGDNCKLQNYALVYEPAVLGDGLFVGPAVL